jgi:hypothetical protein
MTIAEDQSVPLFIRRVMPKATAAELRAGTETFLRYMKIIVRIHERIDGDSREITF